MSEEFKPIVRIADVDLRGDKSVAYALADIKGIGVNTAFAACRKLNIDPLKKLGTLSEAEIKRLDAAVRDLRKLGFPGWFLNRPRDPELGEDLHLIGSDLLVKVKMDIELLKKIRCWRGVRHMLGLKVRGQRTRTTGRTGITVGVRRRKK
ncbi:MAG TPA: 30S ribosomal protein S13 [Candidatus Korarchaeota archaeon]|nr:30S ribosomal protein S13 [Candidatus Korarchaeota archaeon]